MTEGGNSRSFKAKLLIDRSGAFLLEGVTPVGTTAFMLYAGGDGAVWVDPMHGTYWRGEVSDILPLFRGRPSADVAMLLVGIPPDERTSAAPDDRGVMRGESMVYRLGAAGLAEAKTADGGLIVSYDPAVFPPSKLAVRYGAEGRALSLEHLDLSAGDVKVSAPAIDPSYALVKPAGL